MGLTQRLGAAPIDRGLLEAITGTLICALTSRLRQQP